MVGVAIGCGFIDAITTEFTKTCKKKPDIFSNDLNSSMKNVCFLYLIQIFVCGFIIEFMNHEKPTRNISKTTAMVLSVSDKLQWMAITQIESVNNCQPTAIAKNQCTYCSCYVVNSMCCHNLIMATPPLPLLKTTMLLSWGFMKEMIIMKLSKHDSLPQSSQSRTKKIM